MNTKAKKPISKWRARFIACNFFIVALTIIFILHQAFLVYTPTSSQSDILKHDFNYNELTQSIQKLEDSMGHVEGAYKENYRDKEFEEPFRKYKVSSLNMQRFSFESTIFELRASQYKNLKLLLNGGMNHGGHVCISRTLEAYSTSHSRYMDSIIVNVTAYSNRQELLSEIQIFGYESKDGFLVQVDHDKKWFGFPRKSKQKDHLSYSVDITFPYWLTYYGSLEIQAKNAKRIEGDEGLEDIQFDFFKIGLGQGTIIFNKLYADDIQLSVLRGMILGTYMPYNNFMSASLQGANKVHINPTSEQFNITASSTFGPVAVDLSAKSFAGGFTLFHLLGGTPHIEAPNEEDIHITKSQFGIKEGYYKAPHTDSKVVIVSKFGGPPSLYLLENGDF